MDFAELANALNRFGNDNVMRNVNIDDLVGKTIEFTGSFGEPDGDEISVMPIFMEVR
jgi:predicted lipoprotein